MHLVAQRAQLLGRREPAGPGADDADRLRALLRGRRAGFTQPCSKAVSVMKRSTAPMVTLSKPFSMTQLPSHSRSCGQMRPQISGKVLVALLTS